MSWVNLNDVYVNKTGDTIAGDLSVGGALTVNDGKGTNTTYNVANEITTVVNEITTLRDSVSQVSKSLSKTRVLFKTFVFSGSGRNSAISGSDIANKFGISTSEIQSKLAAIVYNGDLGANSCAISYYLDKDGLSVIANTSGMYRVYVYIIMP